MLSAAGKPATAGLLAYCRRSRTESLVSMGMIGFRAGQEPLKTSFHIESRDHGAAANSQFSPKIPSHEVPEGGLGIREVGGDAEAVAQHEYTACMMQ